MHMCGHFLYKYHRKKKKKSFEQPVSNYIDLSLTVSCKMHIFNSLKITGLYESFLLRNWTALVRRFDSLDSFVFESDYTCCAVFFD